MHPCIPPIRATMSITNLYWLMYSKFANLECNFCIIYLSSSVQLVFSCTFFCKATLLNPNSHHGDFIPPIHIFYRSSIYDVASWSKSLFLLASGMIKMLSDLVSSGTRQGSIVQQQQDLTTPRKIVIQLLLLRHICLIFPYYT